MSSNQPYRPAVRHVFWSDEDNVWLATCPAFRGLSAFGDTPVEALTEFETVLQAALEIYEAEEWRIPHMQPDLKWTTTPPTVKGWYWNCKPGETPMLTLVARLDSQWTKKERRFWLGPLPKPEPPGVEQSIQQENTHEKLHTYQFCA